MSPTPSMNSVPPLAASARPGQARPGWVAVAPVKAPRSWPNSADSNRFFFAGWNSPLPPAAAAPGRQPRVRHAPPAPCRCPIHSAAARWPRMAPRVPPAPACAEKPGRGRSFSVCPALVLPRQAVPSSRQKTPARPGHCAAATVRCSRTPRRAAGGAGAARARAGAKPGPAPAGTTRPSGRRACQSGATPRSRCGPTRCAQG